MPTTVPIPSWNAEGLLPSVERVNPTSSNRSPYPVSLSDVVMRFNTGSERAAILRGFLDYRASLHAAGLIAGFQWLDGSFVEHIEVSPRNRPPADVDVVTFYRLPPGVSQASVVASAPDLFPNDAPGIVAQKAQYKVDARTVHLGLSSERLVDRGTYWSGVWGHQRNTFKWKGFLQIDLGPGEDAAARALLAPLPLGGQP